ncbi:MAG: FecR domain-containing protein [Planctomycetes bacterium]|nr:FecR domain-containing protein [Planctomycetota bacterium]
MNCDQAMNLINARIDRQIEPVEGAALDRHLEACPVCREAFCGLEAQDRELRRAFAAPRENARKLAAKVLASLPETSRGRTPKRRPFRWLPIALAAAAGFQAAVLLFQPWRQRLPEAPAPVAVAPPQPALPSRPPDAAPAAPAARLDLAAGPVELLPPGEAAWRPIVVTGAIPAGSRLRTEAKARGEIALADGSQVRLDHDTEIRLSEERRLELLRGRIWSAAKGKAPFAVEVPAAAMSLEAPEAQIDVLAEADRATVRVLEGAAVVKGQEREQAVPRGSTATVAAGRIREVKKEYDLVRQINWIHEILILKGGQNEELARRIDDLFAQIGQTKMELLYEQDIRALGDHCVIPLIRYVQSERSKGDEEKRVKAAGIVSDLAQPEHLADLLRLLADASAEVRYYAARALRRLTGHSLGRAQEDWRRLQGRNLDEALREWQRWWEKNQDGYPVAR